MSTQSRCPDKSANHIKFLYLIYLWFAQMFNIDTWETEFPVCVCLHFFQLKSQPVNPSRLHRREHMDAFDRIKMSHRMQRSTTSIMFNGKWQFMFVHSRIEREGEEKMQTILLEKSLLCLVSRIMYDLLHAQRILFSVYYFVNMCAVVKRRNARVHTD